MQLRTHNFMLKSDGLRYQRLAQLPFLLGGLFLAAMSLVGLFRIWVSMKS